VFQSASWRTFIFCEIQSCYYNAAPLELKPGNNDNNDNNDNAINPTTQSF
jgi:hypothetical protein